ncbi:DUF6188 family protein [Kitasatospora misakiensis]|uniref:DUF6188 family protein n=1 Tax=Kitasatospora misakiensis TaxID=67330 RepID=A0ABW0X4S7_9ACTN
MQNMQNTRHPAPSGDPLDVALVGRRVTAVSGGDRLDLTLDGAVTVRVAHEFRFAGRAAVQHFFPALTFRPTGPLLGLVGREVGSARVTRAGGLELSFTGGPVDDREADGGETLSVPPHALIAPWSVFTPDGTISAGLPGGAVAGPEEPLG